MSLTLPESLHKTPTVQVKQEAPLLVSAVDIISIHLNMYPRLQAMMTIE